MGKWNGCETYAEDLEDVRVTNEVKSYGLRAALFHGRGHLAEHRPRRLAGLIPVLADNSENSVKML